MKKIIFSLGLALLGVIPIFACDVCGCAVGANSFGILPQFRKHFVGVRFQYRAFDSEHPALPGESGFQSSKERFYTAEVWGRWALRPDLQLFGFVPFQENYRQEAGEVQRAFGMGDISLVMNWMVFEWGDTQGSSWSHALQVGGGVKLPTGDTQVTLQGQRLLRNMQPGTGSWDVPIHATYVMRSRSLGLFTEANYRLQTRDKEGYQFGNRFSGSLRTIYWRETRGFVFLPGIGILWEHSGADYVHRLRQDLTGGQSLWFHAGAEIFLSRAAISFQYQHPLRHAVNGGFVTPRPRISVGAMLLF